MINLHDYRNNIFSQNGEDGILEKLFLEMNIETGIFCEFGAWDGEYLSNTCALYKKGWKGIYIEGNRARFAELSKNINGVNANVICAFVEPREENCLDTILGGSSLLGGTKHIDLLSIDIDSDDLAVFDSMKRYRTSVLVIEYNPTIPLEVEYVNPSGENKGNSPRSIILCLKKKDYELVAVTSCNLIFAAKEVLPDSVMVFGIEDTELFTGARWFLGYDGTLISSVVEQGDRICKMPELGKIYWKKGVLIQPVPSVFRHYDQGKAMDFFLQIFSVYSSFVTRPVSTCRGMYHWVRSKIQK